MTIEHEEMDRIIRRNSRIAIALAMEGRWREAVEANKEILTLIPSDVETLNRLGRAYTELHDYAQARLAYQKAKELDPYNSIAEKNLKRLADLAEQDGSSEEDERPVEPRYFIEETGKAGVVRLVNLAPRQVLARMVAGDRLSLKPADGNLMVTDAAGTILGWVEPRHGQRLARLMAGGNKYQASVVSGSDDGLSVMVREIYQDPSQIGLLSFPSKGLEAVHPYVSEKLLRSRMEFEEENAEELGFNGEEEETEPVTTEEPEELDEEEG
jgi:hypothetical protein